MGVSDLTLLSKISNDEINGNLHKRFDAGQIYTYIGHVLISVNPFRDLGIYTPDVIASYKSKNRLEMSPHVFAIADSAYRNMMGYKDNQCIIISGESGAGKTEAAKQVMQFIANVSGGSNTSIQEVKNMVLATNPLLESFGCAKTLRNNNSSRHGKYLQIQFNAQGEPVGATITNYLLEKSRVVQQIKDERNFHIFYQFTKGATAFHRETYGVQPPESYIYTSKSRCFNVDGIDDVHDFAETLGAMQTIGISQEEQNDIFRVLAAVLWLGNVQFGENAEGNAAISDESVPNFVAYLLGVEPQHVIKAVTSRVVETQRGGKRGSVYEVPLNPTQAIAVRDALSKALYNNLFDWIVNRVNKSMHDRGSVSTTVGILDIYGFEIFETNSFEQLCINYVNEKLQQIFIQLTLKTEQEEYVREKIQWTPIDYFNNKIVCDLIEEKRPPGIFAALNDAVATAHADSSAADSTFAQRVGQLSSHPHFEARQGQFLVKHYAGDVTYTIRGMTDRNKDVLLRDLLDLVAASQVPFLLDLFPDRVDHSSKKRPPTAGDKIKSSANDLVTTLMLAQPSYIRTIKPNSNKSPSEYDDRAVLHQVKYLGLQENVRIRRAGFAYRQTFDKFAERFYLLSKKTGYAGDYIWKGDPQGACRQILKDTGIPSSEYQMGVTKAFIKTPETLFALEGMRDRYWHMMATRIQRAWRRFLQHRIDCAIKIQRMWRSKDVALEYSRLRDDSQRVLGGRKERRRFSLLGSRKFLGDYLEVNGRAGFGALLRNYLGNEPVELSGPCEVLVSKLGRSSRALPRYFCMTRKAISFIAVSAVGGQLQVTVERSISIPTIRYVALSNLCDDWVAISVERSPEPDMFFTLVFKTEMLTRLSRIRNLDIRIGPTIEYNKKPGKVQVVKFNKDGSLRGDSVYKSSAVTCPPGEPPTSNIRPMPMKKQAVARKAVATRPMANGTTVKPAAKPAAKAASKVRAPPAPPAPLPTPATSTPLYRALYDFQASSASEMTLSQGDLVEIATKGTTGWWLAKNNGKEGWVPENYLKLVESKKKPPPPPPQNGFIPL